MGARGERQRGAKGAKGVKGSKAYSILGFRVPVTWNEKSSITTCSGEVSPPPETTMPTTCAFSEPQKAFIGLHHLLKVLGQKPSINY